MPWNQGLVFRTYMPYDIVSMRIPFHSDKENLGLAQISLMEKQTTQLNQINSPCADYDDVRSNFNELGYLKRENSRMTSREWDPRSCEVNNDLNLDYI